MTAATYQYRARSIDGTLIEGTMRAAGEESVVAHLRTRALYVTSVLPSTALRELAPRMHSGKGESRARATVVLFRAIAALTKAGIPLLRALAAAAAQCRHHALREALAAVRAEVQSGLSLSAAMEARPREFRDLHVAMIAAGEQSGKLDETLSRLADMVKREENLRAKIRVALAYPATVTVLAIALFIGTLIVVVPELARMFDEFNLEIPISTKLLLALSTMLRDPRGVSLLALAGTVSGVLTVALLRSSRGKRLRDRAIFAFPFAGAVLKKIALARLVRTLGAMLASGVSLVAALDAAVTVARYEPFDAALRAAREAVRNGSGLSASFAANAAFDPMLVQFVELGEESGSLDSMLSHAAEHYESEAEFAIAALGSILEPLVICGIGCIVGAIVLSIFSPLYGLIGAIH
jgi:type IV pilus assembly protein PilC